LEISQRNCKGERLGRAETLVQGQMKAMSYLKQALGRPLSLMPQLFFGDEKEYRKVGMYITHLFLIFTIL